MFKFLKKKFQKKKIDNSLGVSFKVKQSLVTVGKYTYGFANLNIIEYGNGTNLYIGKYTSIAPGVKVFLGYGGHNFENVSTYPFHSLYTKVFDGKKNLLKDDRNKGDVYIGNDVWIGLDVLILNGVKIGDGAVIGANSVVTKNIQPYEFVAGNPAKHIRYRFEKEIVDILLKLKWWDLNENEVKEILPILQNHPRKEELLNILKNKSLKNAL